MVVSDQSVTLWTRNENPISDFGGSYDFNQDIAPGTEMTVLEVTHGVTISRFNDPDGEGHVPTIAMYCVQYKVQLADGTTGYLVVNDTSTFIGAASQFLFGGPTISEAPSMGAQQ